MYVSKKKSISWSCLHLIYDYTLVCTIAKKERNSTLVSCFINRKRERKKEEFVNRQKHILEKEIKLTFVELYLEEVMCLKENKEIIHD